VWLWLRVHFEGRTEIVYNPNANWTARTNAGAKEPVYAVRFDDIDATTLYTTAPVLTPTSTIKQYLLTPGSVRQKLSQLTGKASMTLFSFDLVDKSGDITTIVLSNNMINTKVTLLSGYADIIQADYAPVATGQVRQVELNRDAVTYTFSLTDFKRHQQDKIFLNAEAEGQNVATRLAADAAAGNGFIDVVQVLAIEVGNKLFIGPSTDAVDTGDEESLEVAFISPDAVPPRIHFQGALASNYDADDEVRWATTLVRGNPINILFALLTGDFAHVSFPIDKQRGLPTGLGIAVADIDTVALIAERDDFYGDEVYEFEVKQPERAFDFIEKQLYKFLGYPRIAPDGKMSIRLWGPPRSDDAAAGLPTIKEVDILQWEWIEDLGLHVNRVEIGTSFDVVNNKPANIQVFEDTTDQTNTKETALMAQQKTGIQASLRGFRLAEQRGHAALRRYKPRVRQLAIELGLVRRALELGEVVEVTHTQIPNSRGTTKGITNQRFEIVERVEQFDNANMVLLLQDARFSRPAWIAPDAAPDYGAASAADKERAYIAPDAGNFPDSGTPYEII